MTHLQAITDQADADYRRYWLAARYLDHPEPGQLLRWHHPLFGRAGTDDLPSRRLANSSEPDRSIYAALRAGDIPATGPLI
ncbi:hypothetical protein [Micromonospora sp. NPDC023814]|uniref:hypothetical protein n=1 Tax=Micromonospora sp. NPDC023814 TaxID=3154596 RepID=UPI0033ECE30E